MNQVLLNNFFYIKHIDKESDVTNPVISFELNTNHEILKGHFPQQALVPGVCMVEIIKECASEILESDLLLISASNIKYTNQMLPLKDAIYNLVISFRETTSVTDDIIAISAIISKENTTFIKFQGIFKKPASV